MPNRNWKSAAEIRRSFLEYFQEQGHEMLPSSSLVPANDPTLLFTNAGMVQFKDQFLNPAAFKMKRAVTSQRCLRVGGKHNDLENVGYTARHHTFFEMLGNFSFGDYFKEMAIGFAWTFLTVKLGLPADRLWVTVFEKDDDAEALWRKRTAGSGLRGILRMGEKDNFWSMGDTGPCGPCSEIHFDHGKDFGCQKPTCAVGCDCGRFLEIWNLVFMQFNRDASGKLSPLPQPCIDTGMGLERIASVVQGKLSNYQTDLFQEIIKRTVKMLNVSYDANKPAATDASLHVIADHLRALVFMIADGIVPSNEGRGYVLRRILRRAMRHGRALGADRPFLFELSQQVFSEMEEAYPYLAKQQPFVQKTIEEEEKQFLLTLDRGLDLLQEAIAPLKAKKATTFPGATAFHLYETYGFPVDLTEDILRSAGITLKREEFEAAQQAHREKAKGTWRGEAGEQLYTVAEASLQELTLKPTEFIGYHHLKGEAELIAILDGSGKPLRDLKSPAEVLLVFSQTPFYAESGGQVGDAGFIRNDDAKLEVVEVKKTRGLFLHRAKLTQGEIRQGKAYQLLVNEPRRKLISRNHTLTHLLHAALNEILGDHIRQAGSYLDDKSLSFDFTHPAPIQPEQMQALERSIHDKIWGNYPLRVENLSYQEAVARGAKAFFAEKYGDVVRVVQYGDFSSELCGGTHVALTGEIGLCRVTSERSVAAKTRRLELTSGVIALDQWQAETARLRLLAETLQVGQGEIEKRIEQLLGETKRLQKEMSSKAQAGLGVTVREIANGASQHPQFKMATALLNDLQVETLRDCVDKVLEQIRPGIVALGSATGGRANLVVKVSPELTQKVSANQLIKEVSALIGGGGGGRPDMAQAGGSDPSKLAEALEKIRHSVTTLTIQA